MSDVSMMPVPSGRDLRRTLTRTARAITAKAENPGNTQQTIQATVTAVNTANQKIDVTTSFGDLHNIDTLASYTPIVGDVVWIQDLRHGRWICLGPLNDAPAPAATNQYPKIKAVTVKSTMQTGITTAVTTIITATFTPIDGHYYRYMFSGLRLQSGTSATFPGFIIQDNAPTNSMYVDMYLLSSIGAASGAGMPTISVEGQPQSAGALVTVSGKVQFNVNTNNQAGGSPYCSLTVEDLGTPADWALG